MNEQEYIERNDIYNSQLEQPEPRFSIKNTLIEMGKFTAGMLVVGKLSNIGARSVYKQMMKRAPAMARDVAKNLGSAVEDNKINLGGLFRGVRQTLATQPEGVFNISTDTGKDVMRILSTGSKASLQIGQSFKNLHTNWSGSKSLIKKGVAGFGKHLYKSAPIAAGWYGLTRVTGMAEGEQPSWYNLPGHVGQVAKMTAEFAAFDTGIGGIKKLGGFAANYAKGILNAEASPGFNAFLDKTFAITRNKDGAKAGSFLDKVFKVAAFSDGLREASKTTGTAVMNTFMRKWGTASERQAHNSSLFNFGKRDFYRDTYNRAKTSFKSAYKGRMDALKNYRGDNATFFNDSLNNMIAAHMKIEAGTLKENLRTGDASLARGSILSTHGAIQGKDLSFVQALRENLDARKLSSSKTMGGSILGRQGASAKDIMTGMDRKQSNIMFKMMKGFMSDTVGRDEISLLKKSFESMYAGKGIYKSSGGVVDYSMYQPRNLMRGLLSYASPYMKFGFFGRELPISKIFGLESYLAKEGLGFHTIRADEGQKYYARSSTGESASTPTIIGGDIKNGEGRLGGVLLNNELFVVGSEGFLTKANTPRMKMVYSTPYARESVLYKLQADAATIGNKTIKTSGEISDGKKPSITERIENFSSRWGLGLPSPVHAMFRSLNEAFGFSPMRTGAKSAVDLLLDPRSTISSLSGDANALISSVGHIGNQASVRLTHTLSHPKMMQIMGRLSKDIGQDASDRVSALMEGFQGTDRELMNIIRNRGSFENNEQFKYALEHFEVNSDLTEQIGSHAFNIRQVPLTKRQEIQRQLLNETLGMQGLPGVNTDVSSFNLAAKMLQDNEALKNLSSAEVKDLKMLSTQIDLFRFGHLDGSGKATLNYNTEVKKDALDIIRENLTSERMALETNMFHTPLIGRIGVMGIGATTKKPSFNDLYTKALDTTKRNKFNHSPFILLEEESANTLSFKANSIIDRMLDLGNTVGLKYGLKDRQPFRFKLPELKVPLFGTQYTIGGTEKKLGGPMASLMKRVAQGVGVLAAAQAMDTFTDQVPLFNGTILDKGIYSATADIYVKASMAYHKVQDLTGITRAAKYLEGLMPASMSTIPGMIAGGLSKGPMGIIPGAVVNRFLDANGITPNFDKSYEEMKNTYSGKELVPIRKNRFWLFSKSPFEGDAPSYFRPHWYPKLKSQYKYSDTLYGSKTEAFLYAPWTGTGFNPIGHVLDKYHYERKHYWDRPYAQTAPAFSEVPIIGSILGATIGKLPIIGKPIKNMHLDEISHYYSMDGSNTAGDGELSSSNMPKVTSTEQILQMNDRYNLNSKTALRGDILPKNLSPYGVMTTLGEQLYNFTEVAGLKGFQLESLMGGGLADNKPRFSKASDMWSARRAFWDMNAGDLLGSTEFLRRMVPKEKKIWQKINPLRNKMASWLPSQEGEYFQDFLTGDPFTKIQEGELRLPGDAYNRLYDVKRTFPGRASSLGKRLDSLIQSMSGLTSPLSEDEDDVLESGTAIHRYIQNSLLRNNIGAEAEHFVYDAKNDISGHIDLIMYDPYRKGKKRILEIKSINAKGFSGLTAPKKEHMSQLNFYLRQMQDEVGTLLYINRDDPSQIRTFDVRYSKERFRKDLADLTKARKIAAGIMANGDGFETGTSYSWLDRFRILADVAPFSKEYRDAEEIVSIQLREGKLAESDKEEIAKIKKRRKSVTRKYELYPTRFRSKIFNPDIHYELMSENTNIKAAAEYSFGERVIGSMWERAIQMDTPLNMKLWNYQSPTQHYKRTKIYGSESASWNQPYQDFLKPMFTKSLSKDNPIDAAASFGWIGALGLGGMGNMALPGAVFGGMYGAARTVVGSDSWIPNEVNKKREIETTFDQLKYMKNMHLYEMTGDERYKTEASNTMFSFRQNNYKGDFTQTVRSLPVFEKPYFSAWLKETNPNEREAILEIVPEDVGNILKDRWGLSYNLPEPSKYESNIPNTGWEGFLDNENLSDIKVKTIEQSGLRAHDFGLGWYDQQRRINNSNYRLDSIKSIAQVSSSNDVSSKIKSALMKYLGSISKRPLISISITPGGEDSTKLQINLMRDRFNDIKNAMKAKN